MRFTKTRLLTLLVAINTAVIAQESTNGSALEFSRTEVVPITDLQNDRGYELYIRLPEGYSENVDQQYPVIYYTDAMWHVETLSGSAEYIMGDAILVGISWQVDINEELKKEVGAHVSRYRDYSFRASSNQEYQSKYQFGQADNHLAFIRDDVIPYIESSYRTKPDQRTYFGYSMSGEFGAYILLSQPGTFKNYILGSPSLRSLDIAELAAISANRSSLDANVFISYGSLEDRLGKRAEEFIALLQNRKDASLQLNPVVIEGSHQTAFPMAVVRGVQWVSQIANFPALEGPYFGQKPPGLEAEIFAPGIISVEGRQENGISFSPDLEEVYFSAEKMDGNPAIYFSKIEEGKWTGIQEVGFTNGEKSGEMQPFVSVDNERIYFTGHNSDLSDTKIWYVDRLADSWSEAKRLDLPIDDMIFYANQSKSGDLFFTNISNLKMNYAALKNGAFPEVDDIEIDFGFHGFIAPDEDYMVVNYRHQVDTSRKDHDIFVFFKKKDNSWTGPINLGSAVNSNFDENTPSITPDGKYLIFLRRNRDGGTLDFYWVSTEVIEELRPGK